MPYFVSSRSDRRGRDFLSSASTARPEVLRTTFILCALFLALAGFTPALYATGLIDSPAARVAGTFDNNPSDDDSFFGPRFFLFVNEGQEGVDLNGDGDTSDLVVHMFNGRDESLTNLGLVVRSSSIQTRVMGTVAVIKVDEANQDEDLNNDGNKNKQVDHVYDIARGTLLNTSFADTDVVRIGRFLQIRKIGLVTLLYDMTTGDLINLGFEARLIAHRGMSLLLSISELGQGDINEDGDEFDSVFHSYDLTTFTLTNLFLPEGPFENSGPPTVETSGRFCTFLVDENRFGPSDLNGDGDFQDQVLHIYDFSTNEITNLSLDIREEVFPGERLRRVRFQEDRMAIGVLESEQGGADLNGDGDGLDDVLHVYDANTGVLTNLSLAISDRTTNSSGSRDSFELHGNLLSFAIDEFNQGLTDLNGDGDSFDRVAHLYNMATGELINFGMAGDIRRIGDLYVIEGNEIEQGLTDLNGDGDFLDLTPVVYDPTTMSTTTIPLTVGLAPVHPEDDRTVQVKGSGSTLLFVVHEEHIGNQDFDGDGEAISFVPFIFDGVTGQLTNLGQPVTHSSSGNIVGSRVHYTNSDHNYIYDLKTRLSFETGAPEFRGRLFEHLFVYRVSEDEVLEDLNGDSDQRDKVIHVVILDRELGTGSVNGGIGPVTDVLSFQGQTGTINFPTGEDIELTLDSPPADLDARYILWVWPGRPTQETEFLTPSGDTLGFLVNPIPFGPSPDPQPIACIRSSDFNRGACSGSLRQIIGPERAPFTISKPGFDSPIDFTLQGIIEDSGSANSIGMSVTNAIIIQARD